MQKAYNDANSQIDQIITENKRRKGIVIIPSSQNCRRKYRTACERLAPFCLSANQKKLESKASTTEEYYVLMIDLRRNLHKLQQKLALFLLATSLFLLFAVFLFSFAVVSV